MDLFDWPSFLESSCGRFERLVFHCICLREIIFAEYSEGPTPSVSTILMKPLNFSDSETEFSYKCSLVIDLFTPKFSQSDE